MHIFVEKPLSVKPVEEVKRLARELKAVQQGNGVTVAVGYMLRYSPAVEVRSLANHAQNTPQLASQPGKNLFCEPWVLRTHLPSPVRPWLADMRHLPPEKTK